MAASADDALSLPRFRLSVRARLTALYGGMFLLAGIVLLVVTYYLVQHSLDTGLRAGVISPVDKKAVLQQGQLVVTPGTATTPGADALYRYNKLESAIQGARADTLHSLVYQFLLALGLVAVAALGLGWAIAGHALRPLQLITATARRVADSRLHERIALEGPADEMKELADTFDAMLERLDASFDGQRRFVANASHELRTPLAVNRTLIEVALADPETPPETRQLGRTLLAMNERSERLIDGLLTLARSQNEMSVAREVDLAEVAALAVEALAGEASERGVTVHATLNEAVVLGDGVLLEQLACNVVQNAVRHNVPCGWVNIATMMEGRHAKLIVANSGSQVPAYEVDNLFEPFHRLRRDRTESDKGVGLGLSIVRSVARAHHGEVVASPLPDGGLRVMVKLPPHLRLPPGTPRRALPFAVLDSGNLR
jgi:signal transduction histidine kinase